MQLKRDETFETRAQKDLLCIHFSSFSSSKERKRTEKRVQD
jgi:hypothetical protein